METNKGQSNTPTEHRTHHWTKDEDRQLQKIMEQRAAKNWRAVSHLMGGVRSADQCCQRWNRVLSPSISHADWTTTEDTALKHALLLHPEGHWREIAKHVPGRTGQQCRYRCKHLKRTEQGDLESPSKRPRHNRDPRRPRHVAPLTVEPIEGDCAHFTSFHKLSVLQNDNMGQQMHRLCEVGSSLIARGSGCEADGNHNAAGEEESESSTQGTNSLTEGVEDHRVELPGHNNESDVGTPKLFHSQNAQNGPCISSPSASASSANTMRPSPVSALESDDAMMQSALTLHQLARWALLDSQSVSSPCIRPQGHEVQNTKGAEKMSIHWILN